MNESDAATLAYRVSELEGDIKALQKQVDRLIFALITLTVTIAGSAVVFAITVASVKGR